MTLELSSEATLAQLELRIQKILRAAQIAGYASLVPPFLMFTGILGWLGNGFYLFILLPVLCYFSGVVITILLAINNQRARTLTKSLQVAQSALLRKSTSFMIFGFVFIGLNILQVVFLLFWSYVLFSSMFGFEPLPIYF
ncbi:MAG: hypothetical protein RLZ28_1094 [Actinomycetota bacterium]